MSASEKIPVWIVEDNSSYRKSIALVIDTMEGFCCPRDFSTAEQMLRALNRHPIPSVLISDIGLPGINGIEAVKKVKEQHPDIQIIMLTVHNEDNKIFNAICAGASGYLLKSATEKEILTGIQQVMEGGSPMNTHIARKVLRRFSQISPPSQEYDLTPREKEILQYVIDGFTKKAIALDLDISFHTVDSHMRNIYEKLQVHSRSDAVAKAVKEGIILD
ncbi:response regulator [Fodinibius halophilus]|uniref:Response regulator transcription factor n=1 Tax=Fodinibius halophilus TaxID=1736908 RepID=A0A6M1TDL8_9BACT|nr:response regulator transcription factor [Fodinibius halophilus]NGP90111.1 response regulator transcription factor [Fodinibius halophilus]